MDIRTGPQAPLQKARRAQAAENRAKAWEYRKLGATYTAIGQKLGVSHESVRRYIQATLDQLKRDELKDASEWRRMELARLDDLWLAVGPRANRGELAAVDRGLRIMERRSRMLGLDAPVKVAATDPSGRNPDKAGNREVAEKRLRILVEELVTRAGWTQPPPGWKKDEMSGFGFGEERPCPPEED